MYEVCPNRNENLFVKIFEYFLKAETVRSYQENPVSFSPRIFLKLSFSSILKSNFRKTMTHKASMQPTNLRCDNQPYEHTINVGSVPGPEFFQSTAGPGRAYFTSVILFLFLEQTLSMLFSQFSFSSIRVLLLKIPCRVVYQWVERPNLSDIFQQETFASVSLGVGERGQLIVCISRQVRE